MLAVRSRSARARAAARPAARAAGLGGARPRARARGEEEVTPPITIAGVRPVERLGLQLVLDDGLEVVSGSAAQSLRLGWDDRRTLELRLRCRHWGGYVVGDLRVRVGTASGCSSPRAGSIAARAESSRSPRPCAGSCRPARRSRSRATRWRGRRARLEFADLRAFAPGDRVQAINWQASARRGELVVNERRGPERRRDPLPRHVCGRALRRALHARPGRPGRRDARDALPRPARPRRPRLLRQPPALADPGDGDRTAVPDRRRPARVARLSSTTPGRTSRSFPAARCRRRRSSSR